MELLWVSQVLRWFDYIGMKATIAMGFCIERLRFWSDLHYDIWDWKTALLLELLEYVSIPSFTKGTETGNKDDGQSPRPTSQYEAS